MPTARHCFILSIYNYSIVWPPLICQTPCWTLRTQIRKETIPVPKELTVLAMVMQYMMTTGCLRVQGNAEELSLLGGVKTVFTEKGAFALRQDEQRVWDISGNENGVRENTKMFILAGEKILWNRESRWQDKGKRWGSGFIMEGSSISSEVVWTHPMENRKQN